MNLSPDLLKIWIKEAQKEAQKGTLPYYIPLLEQINPQGFSVCLFDDKNILFSEGNLKLTFPLMSIIKPFLLFYLLIHLGEDTVFQKVGKEASNYPFNSLEQLQQDQGFPRNAMINSGAILLASLIVGDNAAIRTENFCQWLNQTAHVDLFLDQEMLKSVQFKPNLKNQALIQEMVKAGYLKQPDLALETYNQICCLSGTIEDLAKLGLLLMNEDLSLQKYGFLVQEIMLNCGLYEASEGFKNRVGFPTKSGVSGAVLSLIPQEKISLAYYSPPLDKQGNSVAALYFIGKIREIINVLN